LLPGQPRRQYRCGRQRTVAVGRARARARRLPAVGHRRHADQTLWAEGPRRGHPPQSDAGTGRPEVPLRPRLGHARLAGAAPAVGLHRLAAAGIVVRAPEGHGQAAAADQGQVPHQVDDGGGTDRLERRPAAVAGKNRVVRGRWRLRHATVAQVLEAVADRAAIEQNFHDLKEVHGAGQQQVRNYGANVAAYHLNLWLHTLIELWAWPRPHAELCDRTQSPWDDPERRPS